MHFCIPNFLLSKVRLQVFLFIIISSTLIFNATCSAEISVNSKYSSPIILIEGEIKKGDFERFVNAVLQGGTRAKDVFIASNGGDAIESMKIGSLIRQLQFNTLAPLNYDGVPDCDYAVNLSNSKNCTCESACVLIFMSGSKKSGSYLGIHRTFIKHEILKNLSISKASEYSKKISIFVNKYLTQMDAPSSLNEKIINIPSDQIEVLSKSYVYKYLSGYNNSIEEWLIAQCGGSEDEIFLSYFGNKIPEDDIKEKIAKDVNIRSCKKSIMNKVRGGLFYPTMLKTLPTLDKNNIPRRSLLNAVMKYKNTNNIDLKNLLGKNVFDVLDLLTMLGLGQYQSDREIKAAFGKSLRPHMALSMNIDQDGIVTSFYIWFLKNDGNDRMFYRNYFISGLSSDSLLKDFEKIYGKYKYIEKNIDILSGEGNVQGFDYVFYDNNIGIQARFSADGKKLKNIAVYPKKYFEEKKKEGDFIQSLIDSESKSKEE